MPPCAFMKAPMAVFTGYLVSRLPTSEANMFVNRWRAPLRAVEEAAGDRQARLLRVLVGQEEQGAGRHDARRVLRDGVLDGRGDLGRAGLVVEDDARDFVAVDPALRRSAGRSGR